MLCEKNAFHYSISWLSSPLNSAHTITNLRLLCKRWVTWSAHASAELPASLSAESLLTVSEAMKLSKDLLYKYVPYYYLYKLKMLPQRNSIHHLLYTKLTSVQLFLKLTNECSRAFISIFFFLSNEYSLILNLFGSSKWFGLIVDLKMILFLYFQSWCETE